MMNMSPSSLVILVMLALPDPSFGRPNPIPDAVPGPDPQLGALLTAGRFIARGAGFLGRAGVRPAAALGRAGVRPAAALGRASSRVIGPGSANADQFGTYVCIAYSKRRLIPETNSWPGESGCWLTG